MNLYNCSEITDKCIEAISLNCLGLRELNVCNSEGPITDTSIENLAKHSLRLEKLSIAGNRKIGVDAMIHLCMRCTRLVRLDIAGCVNLVWDQKMWEAFSKYLSKNLTVHTDVRDHGLAWYRSSLPYVDSLVSRC